jgi:hypothetical protein
VQGNKLIFAVNGMTSACKGAIDSPGVLAHSDTS